MGPSAELSLYVRPELPPSRVPKRRVKTASLALGENAPVPAKPHEAEGELEQIQFLLSHASVQTTERYIGSKQNLKEAVNDRLQFSLGRYAKLKAKGGPR